MSALGGEIGKIAAFAPGSEIRRSDIDAVTEPVLDAVVFQMTDALGAGDYEGALKKLQVLLPDAAGAHFHPGGGGRSPAPDFRRPDSHRCRQGRGRADEDLRPEGLCRPEDYGDGEAVLPRFCRQAADLVLETDSKPKTSFDEPERLLELCLFQLAQEAKHG